MSDEIKAAEKAFLKSGRSRAMFQGIVRSGQPADAVERLTDGDVEGVVADYFAEHKATVDEEE